MAWIRVVDVWLEDDEPGLSRTMAELDRTLAQGERFVRGLERAERIASPFRDLAMAALEARASARARRAPAVNVGEGRGKGSGPVAVAGASFQAARFCSRGRRPLSARKRLDLHESS